MQEKEFPFFHPAEFDDDLVIRVFSNAKDKFFFKTPIALLEHYLEICETCEYNPSEKLKDTLKDWIQKQAARERKMSMTLLDEKEMDDVIKDLNERRAAYDEILDKLKLHERGVDHWLWTNALQNLYPTTLNDSMHNDVINEMKGMSEFEMNVRFKLIAGITWVQFKQLVDLNKFHI
jgi:hypothetical protein